MTDLQAALEEALEAAGCHARVGEPCSDPVGHHAAAIAAHPALADLARKAAAWEAKCPDCGLTAGLIGRIHINAQAALTAASPEEQDAAEAERRVTDRRLYEMARKAEALDEMRGLLAEIRSAPTIEPVHGLGYAAQAVVMSDALLGRIAALAAASPEERPEDEGPLTLEYDPELGGMSYADLARKAAAWDDATERLHASPTCFCGDHDDIERSFMNGRHLERIAAALAAASPEVARKAAALEDREARLTDLRMEYRLRDLAARIAADFASASPEEQGDD